MRKILHKCHFMKSITCQSTDPTKKSLAYCFFSYELNILPGSPTLFSIYQFDGQCNFHIKRSWRSQSASSFDFSPSSFPALLPSSFFSSLPSSSSFSRHFCKIAQTKATSSTCQYVLVRAGTCRFVLVPAGTCR